MRTTRLSRGHDHVPQLRRVPHAAGEAQLSSHRSARVEIDLGALAVNLRAVRGAVGQAAVYGVVKADAYGHGAPVVALELERLGIDGLAVARATELEELRRVGYCGRLLLLGGPESAEDLGRAIRWTATPVLTRLGQLAAWSAWLRRSRDGAGPALEVVVEVDTGMSRSGLDLSEWPAALDDLRAAPEFRFAGLMSHLAESEKVESSFTGEQERRFAAAVELLDSRERRSAPAHLANSSAALRRASARWTAVRVGGALYGLDLATLVDGSTRARLRPVMSVKAPIVDVRHVATGAGVGYRRTWRAPSPARIALIRVGYGDGFSTGFAGGEVLVREERCPIVGQISMDSLTVDVTRVPTAAIGDECVLLGEQREQRIGVGELAGRAGIAAYEVWCGLNLRLPRLVIDRRDGQSAARGPVRGPSRGGTRRGSAPSSR
ncbi:MAG: alanine racemase [Holophagales bacterium]|nr:alanine racemase [Holophagales bacterium]MYG30146.1 alanine racemase [Holophagales bacterium]MYI78993.1 alanine racemase [Holophagales bacterium]